MGLYDRIMHDTYDRVHTRGVRLDRALSKILNTIAVVSVVGVILGGLWWAFSNLPPLTLQIGGGVFGGVFLALVLARLVGVIGRE